MAWVRLDDTFAEHHKLYTASKPLGTYGYARASSVWMQAMCFTRRALTDGFLPSAAILKFHDPRPREVAAALVEAGLWELVTGGYQIHDYLDYNPSATVINERRAQDSARKKNGIQNHSREIPSPRANVRVSVESSSEENLAEKEGDRIREFLEGYERLYAKFRNGARYFCTRRSVDFDVARQLVKTWPETAWLLKMAELFLRTDHQFAASGSRTIGQFAALASWCDDKLRAPVSDGGAGLKPSQEQAL